MKPIEFKQIIKQAVREAIQEELKDILLEAVRSPKTMVVEAKQLLTGSPESTPELAVDRRKKYMDVLGETAGFNMPEFTPGGDNNISFNSNAFRPTAVNTAAEGSALPSGEVDMSQIMGLLNNK
jgi:hypothetical protein